MSPAAPEPSLATLAFEAFGGLAVVAVTDARALERARDAVEGVVAQFDLACSRFRDDSELAAVNRGAGQWVNVSPLFIEAITAALRAAQLTDGDVDPTVGQALIALGYDRDFAEVVDRPAPARSIVAVPGWQTVQADQAAGAVRVASG